MGKGNLLELVIGSIMAVLGLRGAQWLIGILWRGMSSGNIAMVIGGGVLAYFLLGLSVVFLVVGIGLMLDSIFG